MDVYVPDDVELDSGAVEQLLEALADHLGLEGNLVVCWAGSSR